MTTPNPALKRDGAFYVFHFPTLLPANNPLRGGGKTYSTVTLLARLRGWSTSQPRRVAIS